MSLDRQQAINYLRAPPSGLWRWAEDGGVVIWRDGTTIAFREELIQVLESLSRSGLPPFGAVVLLLAACRGKVPTAEQIVCAPETALPVELAVKAGVLFAARRQLTVQIEDALSHLAKVATLSPEYRSGVAPKCLLAEAVFEPAQVERHTDAAAVLRGMRESPGDKELNEWVELNDVEGAFGTNHVRHVQILAEGLKLYSEESLALRQQTGLDVLPSQTDFDLPPAERARKLIEELSREPEYGVVARAARELMAAVRLPRHLGQREELAIGGVADITNRGPLDRLLVSELAHDDLTLAVRVAINEALYLRREPPMREPPGTLAVLLDSGIRLWGVPRVMATAVALATIACDKRHSRVMVWRAQGKSLVPVDLLSRNGLIEHLGELGLDEHPGEALEKFSAEMPDGTPNQAVVITHADTLADPEFRRALGNTSLDASFVASVNRTGRFELHALPLAHRRPICEADIELGAIFEKTTPFVPLINPGASPDLPAAFGLSPFPFLLPLAGGVTRHTKGHDHFTYAVLGERNLVRFRDTDSGGRTLVAAMPPGRTIWLGCIGERVHVIKAGTNHRPARLISVPALGGEPHVFDLLTGPELVAVHAAAEVVLLIRHQDVRAYSLADGALLGRVVVPYRWVHGRFFSSESSMFFVNWDGERLGFSPVTLPRSYSPSVIALIFDRVGVEGPWIVHRSGEIISSATGESFKTKLPAGVAYGVLSATASADGHQLMLTLPNPPWRCRIDLKSGESRTLPPHASLLALEDRCALPSRNLFRKFDAIAASSEGLALRGRKGRWRSIDYQNGVFRVVGTSTTPESFIPFSAEPLPLPSRYGCSLTVAKWPNGSRAFLDSRGLLHLKSHDAAVPELSLVLADGAAGWTSDGFVCGSQFFFDCPYTSEPEKVFERLREFLRRL